MTHKSWYHSASASSFEKDDMSIKLNCAGASCSYVWSTWLEWTPTMLMWIHAWPCETSDWMTLLVCTWETSLIFHHGPLICFAMCSRKKKDSITLVLPGLHKLQHFGLSVLATSSIPGKWSGQVEMCYFMYSLMSEKRFFTAPLIFCFFKLFKSCSMGSALGCKRYLFVKRCRCLFTDTLLFLQVQSCIDLSNHPWGTHVGVQEFSKCVWYVFHLLIGCPYAFLHAFWS